MYRLIFEVLLFAVLGAGLLYVVNQNGSLEEQLATKEDAIVRLDTRLALQETVHQTTLSELALSQQEQHSLKTEQAAKMQQLASVLEREKRNSSHYQYSVKKLRTELTSLERSQAETAQEKEALALNIQIKEEAIRRLQNAQKSNECLKADLPGSALDELYGMRSKKRGES